MARALVAHGLRRGTRIDRKLGFVLLLIVPLEILLVVEVRAADDAVVFVRVSHMSSSSRARRGRCRAAIARMLERAREIDCKVSTDACCVRTLAPTELAPSTATGVGRGLSLS